jgi:hypothetical protein
MEYRGCFMKAKMLILALAVFLLIAQSPAAAESEYFYYAGDTIIYVDIFDCRAAVKFDTSLNIDPAQFAAEHEYLKGDTSYGHLGPFKVFRIRPGYDYEFAAEELNKLDEVFMVNPVIKYHCYPIHITDQLIVAFKDSVTRSQIDSINQQFGTIIFDSLGEPNPAYALYYPGDTDDNLFDLSNRYHVTGLCRYSTPNMIYSFEYQYITNPRGDVNDDDEVNVADAVHLINYIFLSGPGIAMHHILGDTNCDLDVNFVDIIYLINYLFRGGPAPGTQ